MSTFLHISEGSVQRVSSLKEKEHRRDWEKMFDQHYILPVVKKLDQEMEKAMDLIASDDQHGMSSDSLSIIL